jgi:hypothetical protein
MMFWSFFVFLIIIWKLLLWFRLLRICHFRFNLFFFIFLLIIWCLLFGIMFWWNFFRRFTFLFFDYFLLKINIKISHFSYKITRFIQFILN